MNLIDHIGNKVTVWTVEGNSMTDRTLITADEMGIVVSPYGEAAHEVFVPWNRVKYVDLLCAQEAVGMPERAKVGDVVRSARTGKSMTVRAVSPVAVFNKPEGEGGDRMRHGDYTIVKRADETVSPRELGTCGYCGKVVREDQKFSGWNMFGTNPKYSHVACLPVDGEKSEPTTSELVAMLSKRHGVYVRHATIGEPANDIIRDINAHIDATGDTILVVPD